MTDRIRPCIERRHRDDDSAVQVAKKEASHKVPNTTMVRRRDEFVFIGGEENGGVSLMAQARRCDGLRDMPVRRFRFVTAG